ncbi:MAG: hypothetical protein WCK67_00240 [bacterium]
MHPIEELSLHFKNIIVQARKEILVFNKYERGINLLEEIEPELKNNALSFKDNALFFYNTLAFAHFENKNYDLAAKIYYQINELYQAGFCEILMGSPLVAKKVWDKIPDSEPVKWGKSFLMLIDDNISNPKVPSLLQIRNHLESDLNYLIQADRVDYAENLINCADILVEVNPESYKFIGKALMTNGFNNIAADFLLKSQKVIPNDPEIYYFLGQYSYNLGSIDEAINMFGQCLDINNAYTPARLMIEKLKDKTKIPHS